MDQRTNKYMTYTNVRQWFHYRTLQLPYEPARSRGLEPTQAIGASSLYILLSQRGRF